MRAAFVAAAAALLPVPAQSATPQTLYDTGNIFLDYCEGSLKPECWSYVVGVMEGMGATAAELNVKLFCTEPGVTVAQVYDIAIDYIRAHPQKRHHPTYALIYMALTAAFPCRGTK